MANVTTRSRTRQPILSFNDNINNTLVFDDNQETISNTEFNDFDSDNSVKIIRM